MRTLISAVVLVSAILVVACTTIPTGVDPVQYRVREAQLNLDTVDKAIPGSGFTQKDETRLHALIATLQKVLAGTKGMASGDAISALEAAIPPLQEAAKQISDPKAQANAQRVLAIANVTISVLKNQAELQKEFPSVPATTK